MALCFHHADRETGRACTRCGRPACPDCLVQASVGSHCFECVKAATPPATTRVRQAIRTRRLLVTPAIVAVTVAVFVYIGLTEGDFTGSNRTSLDLALFGPAVADGEWWRLLTNSVVHFGVLHLAFNMLILYQVGSWLEPAAGSVRFLLLYVVSVLGGAAGALLLDPNAFTGGASGGVFGVAAAATLAMYRQGVPFGQTAFGPLLVVNLALGFTISNVSIGGHIGGLIGGVLAAEAMIQARRLNRPQWAVPATVLVGAIAVFVAMTAAANPR